MSIKLETCTKQWKSIVVLVTFGFLLTINRAADSNLPFPNQRENTLGAHFNPQKIERLKVSHSGFQKTAGKPHAALRVLLQEEEISVDHFKIRLTVQGSDQNSEVQISWPILEDVIIQESDLPGELNLVGKTPVVLEFEARVSGSNPLIKAFASYEKEGVKFSATHDLQIKLQENSAFINSQNIRSLAGSAQTETVNSKTKEESEVINPIHLEDTKVVR